MRCRFHVGREAPNPGYPAKGGTGGVVIVLTHFPHSIAVATVVARLCEGDGLNSGIALY